MPPLIPPALATRAWLAAAQKRFRPTKPGVSLWDNRRRLISELAPGRSFLDLGGMFAVSGDVSFWAEEAGATRVVLFDGGDPSDEFVAKHRERSSSVRYIQGDLHDPIGMAELGTFDVVWCAGVIYHSPSPYLQLEHLRRITGQTLMLGTHVIPEIPGFPQGCVWYPEIPKAMELEFARAHGDQAAGLWGISAPFDRTPQWGYTNCWWGFSMSALRSMLDVARFTVREEFQHIPFFADVVADVAARESLIPPDDFSRERHAQRRIDLADEASATWLG